MVTVTMKKKKDRKLKAQDDCNYTFEFCIQKRLEGNILKYSRLGVTRSGEGMGTVTGGEFDWCGNVEVKKFNGVVNGGSNYESLKVAKCLIIQLMTCMNE